MSDEPGDEDFEEPERSDKSPLVDLVGNVDPLLTDLAARLPAPGGKLAEKAQEDDKRAVEDGRAGKAPLRNLLLVLGPHAIFKKVTEPRGVLYRELYAFLERIEGLTPDPWRLQTAARYLLTRACGQLPLGGDHGDALRDLLPKDAESFIEKLGETIIGAIPPDEDDPEPVVAAKAKNAVPPPQRYREKPVEKNDTTRENSLVHEGDFWHVTWRGKHKTIKHLKGLGDLAVLFQRAGEDVPIEELKGGDLRPGKDAREDSLELDLKDLDADELPDVSLRKSLGLHDGKILAPEDQLKIKREIEDLRAIGGPENLEKAHRAERFLRRVLYKGHSKTFENKARVRVAKRIDAAIEALKDQKLLPDLYSHLLAYVTHGNEFCSYKPPENTPRWQVVH